jgi:peptidoglycan LD-endopeptidase LytH
VVLREWSQSPVVAAYDGYLTRSPDWKSSLIIRIPNDPLQPNRQIWIYYTHLADANGASLIDQKIIHLVQPNIM